MAIRSSVATALLPFLLFVSAAHAAPIFSQNARTTAYPSEREFDTLIADDFSLVAHDTALSVSWQGAYAFDGTAPVVDDFEIRFYADAAGEPGALLQTFSVGNAVSRTAVGVLSTFIEYGYTANLGAGFDIAAGTTYWLMIANDTSGDADNWYWSVQEGTGNLRLSLDDGGAWVSTNRPAAAYFTLDNAAVVPEPASIILMGTGVAAAVARRRRGGGAAKAAPGR
jgi:hypothetical protein